MTPVEYPSGIVTLTIFCVCLVSYLTMSTRFGQIRYPENFQFYNCRDYWDLIVNFWTAGFYHANLSHIMTNMAVTLPCMLMIEKKAGPFHLIILYSLCSIVGGLFQFHMLGIGGIGSSSATFGLIFPALVLFTGNNWSRFIVLAVLIVAALEAARWILPDGTGHLAHLGGIVIGIIYTLSVFVEVKPKFMESDY